MKVWTFHPSGVLDVQDRIGGLVSHLINGPREAVFAHVGRVGERYPDARIVHCYGQGTKIEVVLHREHTRAVGTPLAEPLAVA